MTSGVQTYNGSDDETGYIVDSSTYSATDNGVTTTIDPFSFSSGGTDNYTISSNTYATMSFATTTTINSGAGNWTVDNDSYSMNKDYTKSTVDGSWSSIQTYDYVPDLSSLDSTNYSNDDPPGFSTVDSSWTSLGIYYPNLATNACPSDGFSWSNNDTQDYDDITEIFIESGTSSSQYADAYSTSDLEAHVDSLASAQLAANANNWEAGGATASRTLAANESSASETKCKYRFVFYGTDPQQKYTITWQEQTDNGPPVTKSASGVPGSAGTLYYPSESGTELSLPGWPAGCPTGGTHSRSVSNPDITLDSQ